MCRWSRGKRQAARQNGPKSKEHVPCGARGPLGVVPERSGYLGQYLGQLGSEMAGKDRKRVVRAGPVTWEERSAADSAGRVPRGSHPRGPGFESLCAHQVGSPSTKEGLLRSGGQLGGQSGLALSRTACDVARYEPRLSAF